MLLSKGLSWLALLLVNLYRLLFAPLLGGACRFEPSCSEYALIAFDQHPPGHAFLLVLRRLGKCRPGGPFGYDPVPECECQHGR